MRFRKLDDEARTATEAVLVPQMAAEILDHLLGYRQTQPAGQSIGWIVFGQADEAFE